MLTIAMTGGIGCGKTTVANLFAEKKITIIDADIIAHQITAAGSPLLEKIAQHFGQDILNAHGALNRKKLQHTIFLDQEARHWLEQLLHPVIIDAMQAQQQAASSPYVIMVIPLLCEQRDKISGYDRVLVIAADEAQQIKRSTIRDSSSAELVKHIISQQCPADQRLAMADDIIDNNGDLENLQQQVDQLHQLYLNMSC